MKKKQRKQRVTRQQRIEILLRNIGMTKQKAERLLKEARQELKANFPGRRFDMDYIRYNRTDLWNAWNLTHAAHARFPTDL